MVAVTLISPDNHAVLWAVVTAGAATAIWLEQTYRWASRLSGPIIALLLAMLLSNTKVIPTEAPAYGVVETWLVPLALPLLLARANVREILRSGRGPLVAVHLAAVGTLLGTALAVFLFRGVLGSPATEHGAGLMAASYIGGGVNFFAVKSSYAVSESVSSPLLVADNFVMAGVFVALLGLAGSQFFRRHYPHPHIKDGPVGGKPAAAAEHGRREGVSLFDLARSAAYAFAVVAAAFTVEQALKGALAGFAAGGRWQQLAGTLASNRFVLLTAFSLVAATIFARPLARIHGMDEIGGWLLMLFLFVLGAPTDLWAVLSKAPGFFPFCLVIALTNVVFTLAAGRLFRLNLEELLLAMNATLGGPPTAAAMAASAGWHRLVLPGLLIGLWGYVVGTPLGIMVIELLKK